MLKLFAGSPRSGSKRSSNCFGGEIEVPPQTFPQISKSTNKNIPFIAKKTNKKQLKAWQTITNQVSEHTVGKVRRLAEDVEALRVEEADEKKVLKRVTMVLKMVLKRLKMMLKRVTIMLMLVDLRLTFEKERERRKSRSSRKAEHRKEVSTSSLPVSDKLLKSFQWFKTLISWCFWF